MDYITGKKSDNGLRDLLHDVRFADRDVDTKTRKLRRCAYNKFKAAGYMNILFKTHPKVYDAIYFTNGEIIPASTFNRIVWRMSRRGRNAKAYNHRFYISETKKGNIMLPIYLENKLRFVKPENGVRARATKQWRAYCDTVVGGP
jgi:hypothetical protein